MDLQKPALPSRAGAKFTGSSTGTSPRCLHPPNSTASQAPVLLWQWENSVITRLPFPQLQIIEAICTEQVSALFLIIILDKLGKWHQGKVNIYCNFSLTMSLFKILLKLHVTFPQRFHFPPTKHLTDSYKRIAKQNLQNLQNCAWTTEHLIARMHQC